MFIKVGNDIVDIEDNSPKFKRNSSLFYPLGEKKAFSYEIIALPTEKNFRIFEYTNFIGNYQNFKVYSCELLNNDYNVVDYGYLIVSQFERNKGYSMSYQSRERLDWIFDKKMYELDLPPFFAKTGEKRIAVQTLNYQKIGAYSLSIDGKIYTSTDNTNFETKLQSLATQITADVSERQVFAVYDTVRKKILMWRIDFGTFKVKLLPNTQNEAMLVFACIKDNYDDSVNEFLEYANSTVSDTNSLMYYPLIAWEKETFYTHKFFQKFNDFDIYTKTYKNDLNAFCGQFRLKGLLEHILYKYGFTLKSKFLESDFGKYFFLCNNATNAHSYGASSLKNILVEPYINVEDKLPAKTLQELLDDLAVNYNLMVDFDIPNKELIIEHKTDWLQNLPILELEDWQVHKDYSKSFESPQNLGYQYANIPAYFSEQAKNKAYNYEGIGGKDRISSELVFAPINVFSLQYEDMSHIASVFPKEEERMYAISLASTTDPQGTYDNGLMSLCWSVTSPTFSYYGENDVPPVGLGEETVFSFISGFEERGLYKVFYEKFDNLYNFSYIVSRKITVPFYFLKTLTNSIVRIQEQNFLVESFDYQYKNEYIEATLNMYLVNFTTDKTANHSTGNNGNGSGSIEIPEGGGGTTPPENLTKREIECNFYVDCEILKREIECNFYTVATNPNERQIECNFYIDCEIFKREIEYNFYTVEENLTVHIDLIYE